MRKFLAYVFIMTFSSLSLAVGVWAVDQAPSSPIVDNRAVVLPSQPHWIQKIFEPGTSYLKREGVESA
jgi:hypothetical protein